jgi:hypothetical protein
MAKKRRQIQLTGPILPPEPDDDIGAQLAKLNQRLDQVAKENQTLKWQLAHPKPGVGASGPAPVTPEFKLSPEDLGDPVTDPKAYSAKLVGGLKAQFEAQQTADAAARKQASDEQAFQSRVGHQLDALWEKMLDDHPEVEHAKDLIETVARKLVADRMQAGETLEAILFADAEGLVEDLHDKFSARAEELGITLEAEGPVVSTTFASNPTSQGLFPHTIGGPEGDEAGNVLVVKGNPFAKTTSLQGGDTGQPAPRRKKGEAPSTLIGELHAIQKEMGLF